MIAGLPPWLVERFTGAPPAPVCARCGRRDHLILGDGPAICRACILRFGDLVRRPELLTTAAAIFIRAAHGDAVEIGFDLCVHELPGALGVHYRPAWRWLLPWPDDDGTDEVDERIRERLAALRGRA
jgi:hypothetical protein